MIEVDLTGLAFHVIALTLGLVFVLVLAERQRRAKRERRSVRDRVVCRLCLAVFEAPSRDPVQTCPECGAATERRGARPLG